MIDAAWMRDALELFAERITQNRDYLIDLDSAIGDADHGANMDRGMSAVVAALAEKPGDTPAEVLKVAATSLISKVGGAAGPLYGTALLRASTAITGKSALNPEDFVSALTAARDGIVARGKAELGDKTMVDAWSPAIVAAQDAVSAEASTAQVLTVAAEAAEQGAEATIPLIAKKGRASYLGERSAGHQDPGATSSALLLRAFADCAGSDS